MHPNYTITDLTLNYIAQFFYYISAFQDAPISQLWLHKLLGKVAKKQSLSAISISRNLTENTIDGDNFSRVFEQLDQESLSEYSNYFSLVKSLWLNPQNIWKLDLNTIGTCHGLIVGATQKKKSDFRKEKGLITKGVWQNGIKKVVNLEVQVPPEDIARRMQELVDWYETKKGLLNPIILAAIVHYKIAEIHPYTDGNGRLSRIITKIIMLEHGYKEFLLIAPEYFFYVNRFNYFDMLEKTNNTGDLTGWIEFFAEVLLMALQMGMQDLLELSAGSVDLKRRRIIALTSKEESLIDLMLVKRESNAAEIAKSLNQSRQNINVIFKRLVVKGLVMSQGKGPSLRYMLTHAMKTT